LASIRVPQARVPSSRAVSSGNKDPDGVRLELIADPLGEMYGTAVL
jgi:hypothetical protein